MANVREYFNPKTRQKYPIGGCIISNKSPIILGAPPFAKHKRLPPSVDLRQWMTPVEFQGQSNTCSANAVAGAYEFLLKKHTGRHIDASRLFIYYNGRLEDGFTVETMQDVGASIQGVVSGMKRHGCCKETIWRYSLHSINRKPSYESYSSAKRYILTDATRISTDLNTMKSCLANGLPFVFGLKLFQSFHRAATNKGRVPIPSKHEPQSAQHGWHALVAVGYSDKSKAFFVRNSWGTQWGDRGYCYIPYVYMTNPDFCQDIYVIKALPNRHQLHRRHASANDLPRLIFGAQQPDEQTELDERQFWRPTDTFNYYLDFQSKKDFANSIDNQFKQNLIWIDDSTNDIKQIVQSKLSSNKLIKIDCCQSFNEGAQYLFENDEFIRSANCQIVCRSYYREEEKTALHLLEILNDLQLNHLPILMITKNKDRVIFHLNQQATIIDIHNWQQHIFITDQIDELVFQIQLNFTKNS